MTTIWTRATIPAELLPSLDRAAERVFNLGRMTDDDVWATREDFASNYDFSPLIMGGKVDGSEVDMDDDHTCHPGPLCSADGDDCDHESCQQIVHENCPACYAADMDEAEADMMRGRIEARVLDDGICPEDGLNIVFRGIIAAPGAGHSYQCTAGHPWHQHGYGWTNPLTDGVYELTLGDVR